MNGCIYCTKDGECDLYSEGGKFHAFCCNMNSCEWRKMSNYDRIISKTPEELAEFLMRTGACFHDDCDYCNGKDCDECWLGWLRQEAAE